MSKEPVRLPPAARVARMIAKLRESPDDAEKAEAARMLSSLMAGLQVAGKEIAKQRNALRRIAKIYLVEDERAPTMQEGLALLRDDHE